ncbi:hypothetical protein ACQ4PT_017648 [Festuca glaucescens]
MDAPMSSSLGAMGPLLRKLDSLLAPEYRLPHPLKVGIELLKEDLQDISADLVEQSMADFPNKMAKYWMDEVRELSYEIEDCVDNMMARHNGAGTKVRSVHGHRVRRVKIAPLPKTMKPCTRISKITRFRTLVREASQRHERYQLDGCIPSSSYAFTHQPWISTPCHGLAANYLVGIDDSKMKLIQLLTDEAEHELKVVPIVGPAGVGKTTLAKELYRDLGRHYECRAFVRVSRKPDMIKLFLGLLSQVQRRQRHSDVCTVQDLIDILREHLQDKSVYPEGYTIWKVDLVKQWIAEGFISATEGKDAYEVADSYFYELFNMGMIQPMQINHKDKVLSCTVHHTVLDLITQKSKEQNFVTTVTYSQTITATKAYRLSLHFTKSKLAKEPAGALSNVRSVAFFGLLKCMPSIGEFKLLRVVNLEFRSNHDEHISFNLSRISQLLQLRYFKISSDNTVELPGQMQGLQFLETLEINARISAVPLDIVHLPSLLHLRLRDEKILPDGIGCITSLRTLEYFDLSSNSEDSVRSLGELTNLQVLHLVCSSASSDEHLTRNLVALAYSLGKLGNLKYLTLTPGTLSTAVLVDGSGIVVFPPAFLQRLELLPPICIFSRLPVWIGHLRKLCNLKVVVRELLTKDIDMLTGLPALTILSLYVRKPTAEVIVFNRAAFQVLECFKFWCGVLCLAFQEEALPNLQILKIGFNAHRGEHFGHMLTGVEHLLSLKVIDARIGASAGAQDSDKRAAESALKNSISKHLMSPSFNLQMVDHVDEEIPEISSALSLMSSSDLCRTHGGAKRCTVSGCSKSAHGGTDFRVAHGGDPRCSHEGCSRAARGKWSDLCVRHGRGHHRCQFGECTSSAEGSSIFCKAHAGGKKCAVSGCTDSSATRGRTDYCVAHGGGKGCKFVNCTRIATGRTDYCATHGDLNSRCKFASCMRSADCSTDFCTEHAEPKRCTWGILAFITGDEHHQCDRLAESKIGGLCAAHRAEIQDHSVFGGGASDPVLGHQFASDVRPDEIVDAAEPKGDQETKTTKTFIEDEAC